MMVVIVNKSHISTFYNFKIAFIAVTFMKQHLELLLKLKYRTIRMI